MKTVALVLEYDGTGFVGWQRQATGRSVQGVVEAALATLLKQEVRLTASGRTDAGVHALGMVAAFCSPLDLPLTAFREGLNRLLPEEVAVRRALEVPPSFHPRFAARGKWYRYQLRPGPCRSPLLRNRTWQLRGPLDLAAMQSAAADFVGRHDFSAFRSAGCDAATTEREIFSTAVQASEDLVLFDVRGGGFLRNMVRIMTGTLVEVGLGRRSAGDVWHLLRDGHRPAAGLTAPPQGLFLMEVWYGEEDKLQCLPGGL